MDHPIKKLLSLALCLAFCFGAVQASALTADIAIGETDDGSYFYTRLAAAAGDSLWAIADTGSGTQLVRWSGDMTGAPERFTTTADGLAIDAQNYIWQSDEEMDELYSTGPAADSSHNITALYGYEGTLYGINCFTGQVFSIAAENGRVAFTDIIKIQDTSVLSYEDDSYRAAHDFYGLFVQDGFLYLSYQFWIDKREPVLARVDLTDGSVRRYEVPNVYSAAAWHDGKIAVSIYDVENSWDEKLNERVYPTLALMDTETGAVEEICAMPGNTEHIAYSPSLDAIVFQNDTRLMGTFPAEKSSRQVGYCPTSGGYYLLIMDDGVTCALGGWDGIYFRELDANFSTETYLNVYGSWMGDGDKLFASRHPNVPVYYDSKYYESLEDLAQAMISGDDAVDVLQMSVNWSQFTTLMNKGYCLDLSAWPSLTEAVGRMYPSLTSAVTKDGAVYAVPIYASSYGWFYNPSVLEEIGLTADDLPTNLVDLCAFVTRWNDELMDEYQEYQLFDFSGSPRETVLSEIMTQYLNWCQFENKDVTFDTPEFRAVMRAFEDMECRDMEDFYSENDTYDEEDGVYREPLFMTGYETVGDFDWMDYDSEWMLFLPLTLTADTPLNMPTSLEVVFINPRSANADLAAELISCKLETLGTTQEAVLFTDKTEAVENPDYEKSLARQEEYLSELRASLKKAEGLEAADLAQQVSDYEEWIEEFKKTGRWQISQAEIDYYINNVTPIIFPAQPTFLTSTQENAAGELSTLMDRYRDKQINLDQFIREADNKMRMMRLEDQ